MKFKKHLSKKLKDEDLVKKYKILSSKSVFLFGAFLFFVNIFLVGSDKTNSHTFLTFLLPFTYVFFIACLLMLAIQSINVIGGKLNEKQKNLFRFICIGVFTLPLLVFFLDQEAISQIF